MDGSSSLVCDRDFHKIVCVVPSVKRHKSLKPKETQRNQAHLIAIGQELRLLAPAGLLTVGPQCNDGGLSKACQVLAGHLVPAYIKSGSKDLCGLASICIGHNPACVLHELFVCISVFRVSA